MLVEDAPLADSAVAFMRGNEGAALVHALQMGYTAVAGILLLGGGFVPGLSDLDSQRQILAYALVFGYAQQLATQFIDKRAETLLAQVPSKHAKNPPTKSRRGLVAFVVNTLVTAVIVGALAVAVNVYGLNPDVFPNIIPE